MVAAFMKRLAKQCISPCQVTNADDTLFVLALIANLVRRHPRTYKLIRRPQNALSLGLKLHEDPFKANEEDPLKAKAMKSSLWEVEILMKHSVD